MKMDELVKPAIEAVQSRNKISSQFGLKTYNNWMNNIKDWCISRQLQWGHQIQ